MPVSLSEWRVRIGTFVYWIREYEVKERRERLLKERIRRLKVLCERLEAKVGDSGEESEDDKSRQDGPDPKGCPHKTANIRSSGNSSDIKDLLTSCDQCIQELLTASDSHIKEILTPSDTCIKQLLTPRREKLQRIRKLKVLCERLEAKMGDSGEESEYDKSRQDGPDPKRCPHKTLNIRSSGNSSNIKDLLTSCDQCIHELLTANDSHIKDILTPSSCSIKELITPNDCSIKSTNTLNDSTIKEIIAPNDSGIKELVTTNDSSITNLVKANDDSRIQGLFIANDDSRIQDLLTTNYSSIRDPITPKYCSIKDVVVSKNAGTNPLDTQNDSLNASSIKDLITPNDSSILDLITSEYSDVKDLITSNDSKIDSLLIPNENNIKRLIKPDDDYSEEQLAQAYNYVNIVRTIDDESIEQDTQVGDSEEQHISDFSISPRYSQSDASLRELLTSFYPSMKDLQTTTDDLNADLIIKTPYIKDHETQSDGPMRELSSPDSGTTVYQPFAPCDDFLVELLKPSKNVPSIDLHVCCHESDRRNEPFSEESGKLPHFVCKEQHPQPDIITTEATDDELLKKHQTSTGSCKKSQTESSIHTAAKRSPVVPIVSRKYCINDRHGEKKMGESASSCHGPSLKSKTDLISGQIPPLFELLLLKSGDVELNPGPREAAGWSLELERELLSLIKDVSPVHYYELCNALDVSQAQSHVILTKNLLDVSKSLFEVICNWGVKQRDGTNYKRLLAEKLRSVHLDALGTKLVEGGYSTQDTPNQDPILDTSQPSMTEAQVLQCGEDLKTFYREQMCKIKPDPLDFNIIFEFEQIFTNLTLLRNEMGTRTKTPMDYTALLTTKINGVLPKRLLIEGEGGVGKTTFCSKIAWDWVNGSPEFQRFSWVLVIPLRNIVKGQTIGDIMKNYLSDNNAVNPRQISNYILSQPKKVLIVLDGLDEYDGDLSAKESSDISQILRLEKFKECIVLVTTRPWRADQIKSKEGLNRSYAFIAVEGFSAENVSTYISKYFVKDEKAGSELSRFIDVNDVIRENMAPFPIYVAMLCILWENCDSEKRETIRRLKTFSQLFEQMIMFLRDHYVSKVSEANLEKEKESIKFCLHKIGSIAFSGLLKKKLVFIEEDFTSCKEAMETCCRIGVLSRENRNSSRWKRTVTASQPITTSVFFPHKLFQEYIASVYLASLYDTNREEYSRSIGEVLNDNPREYRYLLYFTAALGKEVGLNIVKKIQQIDVHSDRSPLHRSRDRRQNLAYEERRRNNSNFLVDVTFEAYNKDTAKAVGQKIFADKRILTIDKDMPAHTTSGYLFIMEQHGMETLIFRNRSWGPTVSRDLADVLFTSNSLSRLEFYRTTLDGGFYKLMHTQVSTLAEGKSSIKELVVDHQFLNGLQMFNNANINVTVGELFPSLTHLTFATCHTVSPGDIERLTHSSLTVLSIEHGEEEVIGRKLVPLIGEPASLGQLFSNSFPQLTCLTFRELVMGNIRSEAILRNLKNHLHLKSISIIGCFTDDELEPLAEEITTENRMKIRHLQDTAQRTLYFDNSIGPLTIDVIDALCHRTCVTHLKVSREGLKIAGEECFPDLHGREVDSKIKKFIIGNLHLHNDQSASYCLGKFLSFLFHLTDLTLGECSLHDDFFKEIADRASSSQIQKFIIGNLYLHDDQSSSGYLGKFLSLLSHLTFLKIGSCTLHADFYKEIADRASSSQGGKSSIKELVVDHRFLDGLQRFNDVDINVSVGELFPSLTQLTFATWQTVSPGDIERLAHSSLAVLSIEHGEEGGNLVPLIGEPASLGQLFSSSFPQLTCLTFQDLVMGNIRSEAILRNLKNHLHLKLISIIGCFTDDELEPLAEGITTENRMKITLQHDTAQRTLSLDNLTGPLTIDMIDALCHRTCVDYLQVLDVEIGDEECFPDFHGREVDSKITQLCIGDCNMKENPTASRDLAQFLCRLPRLTDLRIRESDHLCLHDYFYHELALLASSSKIEKLFIDGCNLKENDSTSSRDLAKFLCFLPCLTDLTMRESDHLWLHDDFYRELALLASFSKNHFFNKKLPFDERSEELRKMDIKEQRQYIAHLLHPILAETTPSPTGKAHEPPFVIPPDLDVTSTSGTNAQNDNMPGGKLPADINITEAIRKGEAPWNRSRIMVIGPAGVGKTSLIRRLTGQKFNPEEKSTKGAEQNIVTKSAVTSWELVNDVQTAKDDLIQSIAMDPNFGSHRPCSTGGEENRSDPAIAERRRVELEYDQENSVDSVSKEAGRSNSPGTRTRIVQSPPTIETPSTSSQQPMIKENVASTREHRHIAESDKEHVEGLTSSKRIQIKETGSNRSTLGRGSMPTSDNNTIAKISKGITREEITKVKSSALDITYSIWDFGGQEIYYITHPLFLSWRSLYILVIPLDLELSDRAPREEDAQDALKQLKGSAVRTHRTILDLVHFWLMSVYTHAVPDSNIDSTYEPKVLLIGTFAGKEGPLINEKKVTAKFQELKDQLGSNPYWKQVLSPMFGIDNRFSEDSEVNTIQDRIDGLIQDSEYMNVCKPTKWRTFLTEIEGSDQNNLTVKEARPIMERLGINNDNVDDVLTFYHDIGHLIYHQGCELIVLKPQFLNSIVSNIITVIDDKKMEGDLAKYWRDLMKRGILRIELIKAVWKENKGDIKRVDIIIKMMELFDLICEIPNMPDGRQFFVPCRSSCKLDGKEVLDCDDKVEFTIDFHHFLPDGFLHRFYVRMAQWSMKRNTSIKPTFHCREMVFYINNDHRVVMTNEINSTEGHQIKVMIYAVTPYGAPSARQLATVNLNKDIIDHLHETLEDLKKRWARRIQYRVGIWCPRCAEFGDKEWVHIRDILKDEEENACCAEGCLIYVSDIQRAFNKDTTETSRKPVSTSQRPSASPSVDIPPQGASTAAGEVSTSKARPTEESREQDFDDLLKTVAKWIPKHIDIDSIGRELGFEPPEIQRYIQTNEKYQTVTYMGTLSMLRDWRNKTTRSEEREQLKKALVAIDHNRMADDLLSDDTASPAAVTTYSTNLQPKGKNIPNNPEPDSTDKDDSTRGGNQSKRHVSEYDSQDGPPRKRRKKTNRQTPSP